MNKGVVLKIKNRQKEVQKLNRSRLAALGEPLRLSGC
jgi:hypothetical protein